MKRAPDLAVPPALAACAAPAPLVQAVEPMPDGRPHPTVERCCGFLGGRLTGRPGWPWRGWAYGKGGHHHSRYVGPGWRK